ncbi:MAG: hypothetical protein IPM74_18045 [Crocinitomicaceae bacterium]|nr:hypothetical protein [Crocinitomicaceae bacterium]
MARNSGNRLCFAGFSLPDKFSATLLAIILVELLMLFSNHGPVSAQRFVQSQISMGDENKCVLI